MKFKRLRFAVPLAATLAIAAGLAFNLGTGTLSALGWRDLTLLCPLGAFMSMLSAKTFVPRAVLSLAAVIVIVLLTGRAFCSWACPGPLVARLRNAFSRKPRPKAELRALEAHAGQGAGEAEGGKRPLPLTEAERELLRGGTEAGCRACHERLPRVDSRHLVLGGALLSSLLLGFPVFCLVCPIGLTFGTILLVIALFGFGDVTWSVVFVPALLLVEVVLFRKWCSKVCPMGALLSLVAKVNVTFRPKIDKGVCLEFTRGVTCGACTKSCEQGINLRNGKLGAAMSECTRCFACIESCPSGAIRVSPLPSRSGKSDEDGKGSKGTGGGGDGGGSIRDGNGDGANAKAPFANGRADALAALEPISDSEAASAGEPVGTSKEALR